MKFKDNPRVKEAVREYRRAVIKAEINSPYAPIRWSHDPVTGLGAKPKYLQMSELALEDRKPLLMDLFAEIRDKVYEPSAFQSYLSDAQIYGTYVANGRLIFDIGPVMQANLRLMDFSRLKCKMLELAPSCYIHFGRCRLDSTGNQIEGVFVQPSMDADGSKTLRIFAVGAPPVGYDFNTTIAMDDLDRGLVEAIDIANHRTHELNKEMNSEIKGVIETLDAEHDERMVHDMEKDASTPEEIQLAAIVTNCLLYSMYVPDDRNEIDTRANKPSINSAFLRLSGFARSANEKDAANKLMSSDYIKVTRLGTQREVEHEAVAVAKIAGSKKSMHLRRGFWRPQHHGPNNSLLKLVEIKPVIVNKHLGVDSPGRIYTDVGP